MKQITFDKLKIYQNYNRDGDMFIRTGKEKEKLLFCNNEWNLIDNYIQSLVMIKNGLTDEKFAATTLNNLAEISDEKSFKILTLK